MTTTLRRTNWAAIAALALAIVPVALDSSIVAVALPAMGADLAATPATMQWVVHAYFVPMLLLGIPAGRWADDAGSRQPLLLAVAGFGLASALVAASPSLPVLLAARVLQGAFGAIIPAVGFRVVASVSAPEHRGRAMSVIATLLPLGMVAGPGVGGLLVDAYGWRSIFLINIPIAAVTLWLAARTVPGGARLTRPAPSVLDPRPIVALVRRPAVAGPLVSLALVVSSAAAPFFLVPYLLSEVLGESARVAGAVILTLAAATAVVAPLGGWLADRLGARRIAVAGGLCCVLGLTALLTIGPDAAPLDVAWRLALLGIGHGLFTGPLQTAILNAVPEGMAATAGGVTTLFRMVGFTIGPAVAALSWTAAAGGLPGFRAGAAALAAVAAMGVLALVRPARVREMYAAVTPARYK